MSHSSLSEAAVLTLSASPELSGLASARAAPGQPLDDATQRQLVEAFLRDGIILLPGLLAERAAALRTELAEQFAHAPADPGEPLPDIVRFRIFERSRAWRDLIALEPVVSLMEALLGPECHLLSQNALMTQPGKAIDAWHVDDEVFFPLPAGVDQHPVRPPVLVVCAFVLLSDVPDLDHGPTQVVPGSCWSGRHPPSPHEEPVYAGRGPLSICGRAGDVYLQHTQCWHRGAPNRSAQARWLVGTMYGRRYMAQRLYPFVNYQLPPSVEEGADPRLRRLLGHHPRGQAYA